MSRGQYGFRLCPLCGREISAAGVGWVRHGRAHVLRGEAYEAVDPNGVLVFPRPGEPVPTAPPVVLHPRTVEPPAPAQRRPSPRVVLRRRRPPEHSP